MFERSQRTKLRRHSNALLLSQRTTNRGKVTQLWKSLTNDEFALNIGIIVGTEVEYVARHHPILHQGRNREDCENCDSISEQQYG